jgi:hypothetical protein
MKGEKAVAKPKAADSVKSLNIVGSRFFGRHIGFKIYDNSRNLNAGPASRPDVTNLKTIFGGHKITRKMLKLCTFAAVVSTATAFSPFMVRHALVLLCFYD